MPRLRDRPTPDLVVMGLALVVAFSVVAWTIGAIVLRVYNPDANLDKVAIRLAGITNTLIGAIVGYLAGRGVPPNGKSDPPKGPPQ